MIINSPETIGQGLDDISSECPDCEEYCYDEEMEREYQEKELEFLAL